MFPLYPFVPESRGVSAPSPRRIRPILSAIDELGQEEQPDLYRHVHPHSLATGRLARSFAEAISRRGGSRAADPDEVELGAYLHDFGKYLISKSILLKPGPLTWEERSAVSLHPVYGAQVLAGLPSISERVLQVVLHHHERWDGAGYPAGLSGWRIPLAARLVSVVDVYTSLRSRRSYKPTLTKPEACDILKGMAGFDLDPNLVEDFIGLAAGRNRK